MIVLRLSKCLLLSDEKYMFFFFGELCSLEELFERMQLQVKCEHHPGIPTCRCLV